MQKILKGDKDLRFISRMFKIIDTIDVYAEEIGSYDILILHDFFVSGLTSYREVEVVPLFVSKSFHSGNDRGDYCIYKENDNCLARISYSNGEREGVTLREAHEIIFNTTLDRVKDILVNLTLKSISENKEFLLEILNAGDIIVLEGEASSISLPLINGILSLHTHPNDVCILSAKDVRYSLDFLIDGGLFAGAASTKCVSGLLRTRLISEEDYMELMRLTPVLSRFEKKKPLDYVKMLTSLNRSLESIRFTFVSL